MFQTVIDHPIAESNSRIFAKDESFLKFQTSLEITSV